MPQHLPRDHWQPTRPQSASTDVQTIYLSILLMNKLLFLFFILLFFSWFDRPPKTVICGRVRSTHPFSSTSSSGTLSALQTLEYLVLKSGTTTEASMYVYSINFISILQHIQLQTVWFLLQADRWCVIVRFHYNSGWLCWFGYVTGALLFKQWLSELPLSLSKCGTVRD